MGTPCPFLFPHPGKPINTVSDADDGDSSSAAELTYNIMV